MNDNTRAFLGVGWKFPLQVTPAGAIAQASYEQRIEESIYLILATAKGERVRVPDFGCGVHELVFAPNNVTTRALAMHEVREALVRFEPRIDVLEIPRRHHPRGTQPAALPDRLPHPQQQRDRQPRLPVLPRRRDLIMPLESHVPNLDDRRYDDIIDEVRTRIARYTPEWTPVWTDVNDSDPGITMVQVFAWLTEMLLYRLGRVPELNYLKFLELVGIELRPAEPARADVTFPLAVGAATPATVIIPARTQVAAEPAGGAAPVIFETTRDLTALRAQLAAVQAFDGYGYRDATAANDTAGQGFQPFGAAAGPDSALYLGFDDALPRAELDLTAWLFAPPAADRPRDCTVATPTSAAPVSLLWEYWDGTGWSSSRLALLEDETQAFTRAGHLRFRLPPAGSVAPSTQGIVGTPLQWIRARIDGPGYNRAPELLALRSNTVPVEQAETVLDEVLGGSNGSPNQRFLLENAPVLSGSLRLEIDEGELTPGVRTSITTWSERDDLFGSSADDRHYVLNRTSGEIHFGDGDRGRIPNGNINNRSANVIAPLVPRRRRAARKRPARRDHQHAHRDPRGGRRAGNEPGCGVRGP